MGSSNSRNPTRSKKTIPFNTRVDMTNIVELGEGWLYRYFEFLRGRRPLSAQEFTEVCAQIPLSNLDSIMADGAYRWFDARRSQANFELSDQSSLDLAELAGCVVITDVPRGNPSRRNRFNPSSVETPSEKVSTFSGLITTLNRMRTAEGAKSVLFGCPRRPH